MTTLAEELSATWTPAPAATAPPAPAPQSLATELETSWTPPVDGTDPAIYGNPVADVKALANWIAANPQAILDFVLQGAGTAGGIAVGTLGGPASPATMPAGGAAGSVLGKQLARRVGGALGLPDAQPPPDLGSLETAADAGLGAVGPLANTALRGAGRFLTGLDPSDLRLAQRAGVQQDGLRQIAADETERALTAAMTPTRQRNVASFGRSAPAAVGGALMVEPITGSLAGLVTSEVVLSRAVPVILGSRFGEAFSRWAMGAAKQPRGEAAASLAAIFAGQQLTQEERQAVRSLQASILPRDQRTGRFTRERGTADERGNPFVQDDAEEE